MLQFFVGLGIACAVFVIAMIVYFVYDSKRENEVYGGMRVIVSFGMLFGSFVIGQLFSWICF